MTLELVEDTGKAAPPSVGLESRDILGSGCGGGQTGCYWTSRPCVAGGMNSSTASATSGKARGLMLSPGR